MKRVHFNLLVILRNGMNDHSRIQKIYDMDFPAQIGYMYIKKSTNRKHVKALMLNEALAVEYRVYALLSLASIEDNPFSPLRKLQDFFSSFLDEKDLKAIIKKKMKNLSGLARKKY